MPWLRARSSPKPRASSWADTTSALTIPALWYRYFALGGMSSALELEAILYGALVASDHNRDGTMTSGHSDADEPSHPTRDGGSR